ncbi:MAG: FtsQ-type POTRA domain-containing protein [Candidatus Actinomarina sp.]|nr:FtsQ-type POTRA domain-containing protein [Candidatus Actinomarina sp.]
MNEYINNQIVIFKTFLIFSLSCLILLLVVMNTTSQKYRINEITNNIDLSSNLQSLNNLYGKSIWYIDENSFEQIYTDNPVIKKLTITKNLPNKLVVSSELYQQLVTIDDERSSLKNMQILYENNFVVKTEVEENNLPVLVITNGPVEEGFRGELISFFKTLDKYKYVKNELKLQFDGNQFVAFYYLGRYELGPAIDLGRKGSILGTYLEENFCSGTVRFINSETTIENCS